MTDALGYFITIRTHGGPILEIQKRFNLWEQTYDNDTEDNAWVVTKKLWVRLYVQDVVPRLDCSINWYEIPSFLPS